ncbi:MAG: VCBS repeat-containing protein [Burkholderiales bacterium]|nr:VCBS repeat-containing protein [Burkholderiales bacterium]
MTEAGKREMLILVKILRRLLFVAARFAAVLVLVGPAAGGETLTAARYAQPVDRYGHFAPGRPHEYARLTATTNSGRELVLELPQNEVFEDVAPRLVRLAADGPQEILAIISGRASGARLALIGLRGDAIAISAQSAAIGTPNRWLNPVGVADLDGDGRAEIAAVITPHISGTLKVYRRKGAELVEIAALADFSNHVYGTPELALSAPMSIEGRMRLLVPDAARRKLRIIALEGGKVVEIGRCALSAPITGAIKLLSPREISVGLSSSRPVIAVGNCLK